jgi:hypothetical protein
MEGGRERSEKPTRRPGRSHKRRRYCGESNNDSKVVEELILLFDREPYPPDQELESKKL